MVSIGYRYDGFTPRSALDTWLWNGLKTKSIALGLLFLDIPPFERAVVASISEGGKTKMGEISPPCAAVCVKVK